MRLALTALLGAVSLLPAVFGTPVIYIRNFCPYTVYWWHVGQGGIDGSGQLWSGGNSPEGSVEWTVDDAPGQAFKITLESDGLYTGAPVNIFAYNADVSSQTLWVDMSDVYGDPFDGERVTVTGMDGCDPIIWENGVQEGSNIRSCAYSGQPELHLCAQNGG